MEANETGTADYLIGLTLAVISTVFIGTQPIIDISDLFYNFFSGSSFLFKKLGLLRLRKSSLVPASEGGCGYLRDWVWWLGFLTCKSTFFYHT